MRIERLEEDKIKVILTAVDLAELDIDFESITPESPELGRFLKKIIRAISRETGVFIEEGKVLIDAGKDGFSMLIFVIKAQKDFTLGKGRSLKLVKKCDRLIFEACTIEDFFMLLSMLGEKILRRMRIYRYRSRFYISVPRFPTPILAIEFSQRCRKSTILEATLAEHGELIAKDDEAVKMAKEIKKLFGY